VQEELADVFGYSLHLADELGVDLSQALSEEIFSTNRCAPSTNPEVFNDRHGVLTMTCEVRRLQPMGNCQMFYPERDLG
jgi:MazG-like family